MFKRKFSLVLKWIFNLILLLNRAERLIEFIKDMVFNYIEIHNAPDMEVKISAQRQMVF